LRTRRLGKPLRRRASGRAAKAMQPSGVTTRAIRPRTRTPGGAVRTRGEPTKALALRRRPGAGSNSRDQGLVNANQFDPGASAPTPGGLSREEPNGGARRHTDDERRRRRDALSPGDSDELFEEPRSARPSKAKSKFSCPSGDKLNVTVLAGGVRVSKCDSCTMAISKRCA
jgi:hypothetical protein